MITKNERNSTFGIEIRSFKNLNLNFGTVLVDELRMFKTNSLKVDAHINDWIIMRPIFCETMIFSPGYLSLELNYRTLNFQIKLHFRNYHVRLMLFLTTTKGGAVIKSHPICQFGHLSLALSDKLLRQLEW